jgi:hypothetical protein
VLTFFSVYAHKSVLFYTTYSIPSKVGATGPQATVLLLIITTSPPFLSQQFLSYSTKRKGLKAKSMLGQQYVVSSPHDSPFQYYLQYPFKSLITPQTRRHSLAPPLQSFSSNNFSPIISNHISITPPSEMKA